MTRRRREDVLIVALAVSLVLHVLLMLGVKSHLMSRGLPPKFRTTRSAPMLVTKAKLRPAPVRIDAVKDIAAKRDAPAAVGDASAPSAAAPTAADFRIEVPKARPSEDVAPSEERFSFDVRPVGSTAEPEKAVPIARIETPSATAVAKSGPDFTVRPSAVPHPEIALQPTVGKIPDIEPEPAVLPTSSGPIPVFTPAAEVYARVDEQVVSLEKEAVRTLVESGRALDLAKAVTVRLAATRTGDWRYFKVTLAPREDLSVVPKDVVFVIDGSGSVGKDRLGNCTRVAQKILRSCMNSGDRFNLVVFRNAFSYAFRTWRACDAASFAAGDAWLRRQTAYGRTDVFSTIRSVLTLPRDPKRPLVALVVTDGDANAGISDTSEILSKFTALNDGLVSVYMYGVKSSANRELIDVLTQGNRGESFIFEGWRWEAGEGLEALSERFRDPVLSDLRLVFSSRTAVEAYPRLLRNLCRGETVEFVGRLPASAADVAFALRGLNGADAYEGFFKLPLDSAAEDPSLVSDWTAAQAVDRKLGNR